MLKIKNKQTNNHKMCGLEITQTPTSKGKMFSASLVFNLFVCSKNITNINLVTTVPMTVRLFL